MGLLKQAFEPRAASPENPSTNLSNPATWLIEALGGTSSATGITVNEETAMRSAAVFACVNKIAKTIGSLTFPVYERMEPRGKRRAFGHPLYRVLHDQGNEWMTAMTVRQTIQGHAALRGNGYAEIEYDNAGHVRGLWPLRPDRTRPVILENDELWYETVIPKTGELIRLPAYRIFHLLGLSGDGLIGYSPIRQAAEAIGVNLALTKYGGAFFGNGARPGGIITVPAALQMTDPAKDRLQTRWEARHEGLTRAHRVAILDEGMDYKQVGIAPEDAQFLDTMKYSVEEIARLFDMPLHAIQDLDRATNNNIEHQGLELVVYTLRPWLVQWEQTTALKLLTERERLRYFAEHVVDSLLRGDYKSRQEGYNTARQGGWMSANDIRELENMNPLPPEIGDRYLINGNMVPVEKAGANLEPKQPEKPVDARFVPAFQRLIAEAVGRTLRMEANDLRNAVKRFSDRGDMRGFASYLDEYYRDHPARVERQLFPVMLSYAESLCGEQSMDMEEGVRAYVASYASRHIGTSLAQIHRALQSGESVDGVRQATEDWFEGRPNEVARREAEAAGKHFEHMMGVG